MMFLIIPIRLCSSSSKNTLLDNQPNPQYVIKETVTSAAASAAAAAM
jgi:hypothetical protein